MNNPKTFLLDLFFPKFCLGCKKEGSYLCQDCRSLLEICEFNYCLCDKNSLLPPNSSKGKCQRCQNKKLSGLYFALPYNLPALPAGQAGGRQEKSLTKKLICQFKYQPYLKELAETLASILIEHFVISQKNTNEIWNNSVLIPVPLDKNKQKSRGYNQSEELAKELAKVLKIPVISGYLIKTKSTKPQMELSKEEREKNLLNVFSINLKSGGVSDTPPLSGKKVFLVDDVYTTGSTMEECARVLKDAGAKQVWGIVIAREN